MNHIFKRHLSRSSKDYHDLLEKARTTNHEGTQTWTVFPKMLTEKDALEFLFKLFEEAQHPIKEYKGSKNMTITLVEMGYCIGTLPYFCHGRRAEKKLRHFKIVSVKKDEHYYVKTIYPICYKVRFTSQIVVKFNAQRMGLTAKVSFTIALSNMSFSSSFCCRAIKSLPRKPVRLTECRCSSKRKELTRHCAPYTRHQKPTREKHKKQSRGYF